MATASSLISKIHSALLLLPSNPFNDRYVDLRMGLRNLNVLLVCLRNTGNDDTRSLLCTRIEDAIGRIEPNITGRYYGVRDSGREVNFLVKEVISSWWSNITTNRLTLEDVVDVADSILHSITDFWSAVAVVCKIKKNQANQVNLRDLQDLMDGFEVETRFLRDFLRFAGRAGVEIQPMRNLLIHVRPFALDAAVVFQSERSYYGSIINEDWIRGVQNKSPRVDPQVFQACIQTLLSMSTLDQANDGSLKDFLGSLILLLWHVLRYGRHHCHFDSLKPLYEGLRLSRSSLKQQRWPDSNFRHQAGVLIRDAGIFICSLYLAEVDSAYLSDLLRIFATLQAQILPPHSNSLQANALDFGKPSNMEDVSDDNLEIENVMASHQTSNTPRDVGFQEDEVISILDRLTRGAKQLRYVPITGMAGLGKTFFALKVYNHIYVMYHFQARAWCTISQEFNKKKVLLQLLNQIQPGDYSQMNEADLANKLRHSLKQKRYLIFLDDVWTLKAWESLSSSFPNDRTQSRILLTSRLHTIVPSSHLDYPPHSLRLRKESECFEIIKSKLSQNVGPSTQLEKFAKLCKGLPLTAVLVAGLLANTVKEDWEGILNHLSLGGMSNVEQCKIALDYSYQDLPYELKLCFMYFGVFPDDEEIYTKKLFQLWIAEGFVAKKNDLLEKRIEVVAGEYLDNLIQRNLVMVVKKRSMGGVKTCRVHDLLHDFCMLKGNQENLFHCLEQRKNDLANFNEPYNMKRMSIHSTPTHFKESRLFCPRAHSLSFFTTTEKFEDSGLFDMVFIIQTFKHLKVLNVEGIKFKTGIPRDIALFTQLTYLSIKCSLLVIPLSIGNLLNLETLIIESRQITKRSLPYTIWNLLKLKYLNITYSYVSHGFILPIENIENSSRLLELEAICGVEFHCDGSMEKQMRKFPNIRRLKCYISEESLERLNKIVVVPEFLNQLEDLTFSMRNRNQIELVFGSAAEKLRKVKLCRLMLSREEIAVIGKFPNLEVFKLCDISFLGGTIEMGEGEFLKLRILELRGVRKYKLKTWTVAGDEPLPCLEKVLFFGCQRLKEIPCSYLEASSTLEEIEVSDCSSTLESLVKEIEKVQKDSGYSIKLQIYSRSGSEAEETEKEEFSRMK